MSSRRPGEGRYAHVEREQRWMVRAAPADAQRVASIVDRYIRGTRLRLRRTEGDEGVVYKLGQKVRVEPSQPEVVKLTNIYLSAEEHAVLAALPAAELRKTRWYVMWDDRTVAVDVFEGRLTGLVLAEVELRPGEPRLAPPPFAVRDVTDDDRFSGGSLAFATDDALRRVMRAGDA